MKPRSEDTSGAEISKWIAEQGTLNPGKWVIFDLDGRKVLGSGDSNESVRKLVGTRKHVAVVKFTDEGVHGV